MADLQKAERQKQQILSVKSAPGFLLKSPKSVERGRGGKTITCYMLTVAHIWHCSPLVLTFGRAASMKNWLLLVWLRFFASLLLDLSS